MIEERRRRQILQLVWTRTDFQPAARTQRFDQTRGLTPAAKAPCRDCDGGWIQDRFNRRRPCLTCGGKPATEKAQAKGGRGWVNVDPMDTQREPIRTEARDLPTRSPLMVPCDACHDRVKGGGMNGDGTGAVHLRDPADPFSEYRDACPRCDGTGKIPVTEKIRVLLDLDREERDDDAEPVTLDVRLARLRRKGSYDQLDQALTTLPGSMLLALDLAADPRATGPNRLADAALEVLDHHLPDELRVPRVVREAWTALRDRPTLAVGKGAGQTLIQRRDREIRKHDREGRARQWIAAEYGLSVASVKRIVNGESEAA